MSDGIWLAVEHSDKDDSVLATLACGSEKHAWESSQASLLASLNAPAGHVQVEVTVDGRSLLIAFRIDAAEHVRRLREGVAAFTSTGLLHGLWLLPAGVPVNDDALPAVKRGRLRNTRGVVDESTGSLVRTYEPAGNVVGIGVSGRSAGEAIDRACVQSPVFRRVAILRRPPRARGAVLDLAKRSGVGLAVECGGVAEVLLVAPPAVRGVPGVLRWWLAELAYEAWLQERAHAVS